VILGSGEDLEEGSELDSRLAGLGFGEKRQEVVGARGEAVEEGVD